ncbi:uncharacterized protein LOC124945399 [Impatiens glandulifera]|uniref:uncharacterized protein LOC124945399 n=1 Tax=Impatiens glandulifera TaxID=253017 RepID=UPI001FB1370B|nr:uncharacterized protein LOC124945399 [Impatiens glandulifera]
MEVEELGTKPIGVGIERMGSGKDRLKVKRKTLEMVLQQCQMALELLSEADDDTDGVRPAEVEDEEQEGSSIPLVDEETQLCDLIQSRLECPDFIQKIENAQVSIPHNVADEGSSWDMVNKNDIWDSGIDELDQEDFVLVREEDIVEGIACFMAAYLSSLKQTKDLTPNQLQDALSKTFSLKKKKGKLMKAWNGSKVIYNVASWGATAIGIYQNPAILRAASAAFWTSCHVISKLF